MEMPITRQLSQLDRTTMGNMIRWTPEQLADFQAKKQAAPVPAKPSSKVAMQALGRLKSGEMNKTEAAYDAHLAALMHIGQVIWYRFEGIKFRLADNTFLTVDFAVMMSDGRLEMHEVKGFMLDDANVKIKVAASIYPFVFKVIRKGKGGTWQITEI